MASSWLYAVFLTVLVATGTVFAAPCTVTTLADAGAGSLRACVAASGTPIDFVGGLTGRIIFGSQLDLIVSTVIDADAHGRIHLEGDGSSRLFRATSLSLTLRNLVLLRGLRIETLADDDRCGGAIKITGATATLTLTNCTLSKNAVVEPTNRADAFTSTYEGGAVCADDDAHVVLENVRFYENAVFGHNGFVGFSTFGRTARGGAIALLNGAVLSAHGEKVLFVHNAAHGGSAVSDSAGGPGEGGAIFCLRSTINITTDVARVLFSGNEVRGGNGGTATAGRGGRCEGGAVSADKCNVILSARDDITFLRNGAFGGPAGTSSTGSGGRGGTGSGGAILATHGSAVPLVQNLMIGDGSGSVLFQDNVAYGGRGGLAGGSGAGGNGGTGQGGAIVTRGAESRPQGFNFVQSGTRFIGNLARGGDGGSSASGSGGGGADGTGGAIKMDEQHPLPVQFGANIHFIGNVAQGGSGGDTSTGDFGGTGADGEGGAMSIRAEDERDDPPRLVIDFGEGALFRANTAQGGDGGAASGGGGEGIGGALLLETAVKVSFDAHARLIHNRARGGRERFARDGGPSPANPSVGQGGAIALGEDGGSPSAADNSICALEGGAEFIGNRASSGQQLLNVAPALDSTGGAIHSDSFATVNWTRCVRFDANCADDRGGAVFFSENVPGWANNSDVTFCLNRDRNSYDTSNVADGAPGSFTGVPFGSCDVPGETNNCIDVAELCGLHAPLPCGLFRSPCKSDGDCPPPTNADGCSRSVCHATGHCVDERTLCARNGDVQPCADVCGVCRGDGSSCCQLGGATAIDTDLLLACEGDNIADRIQRLEKKLSFEAGALSCGGRPLCDVLDDLEDKLKKTLH